MSTEVYTTDVKINVIKGAIKINLYSNLMSVLLKC
jgi:hypothetical protein